MKANISVGTAAGKHALLYPEFCYRKGAAIAVDILDYSIEVRDLESCGFSAVLLYLDANRHTKALLRKCLGVTMVGNTGDMQAAGEFLLQEAFKYTVSEYPTRRRIEG